MPGHVCSIVDARIYGVQGALPARDRPTAEPTSHLAGSEIVRLNDGVARTDLAAGAAGDQMNPKRAYGFL